MKKQLKNSFKIVFLALCALPMSLISMEPAASAEGKMIVTLSNAANSIVILDDNRVAVNNPAKAGQINVDVVDINQGKSIKTFAGEQGPGFLGAESSKNLLYVAGDRFPLFYDYQKLEKMGHDGRVTNGGHTANITALVVPDAQSVATAGADGKMILLTSDMRAKVIGVGQTLTSLTALNKNRIIGVGNSNTIVDVQKTNTSTFPVGASKFSQIAMLLAGVGHKDGRWALGQQDGKIMILDSTQGNRSKTIAAHNGTIASLKALADKYLVSASADGSVKLWKASFDSLNPSENNAITTLVARVNQVSPVTALDVKYNNATGLAQIVATYGDKSVWQWKLNIDELANPK